MKELKDSVSSCTLTIEQKLKHFGPGEWIDEPNILDWIYKDHECLVIRVAMIEPYAKDENYFGGHLCGYVRLPSDHPYHHKKYEDMDISCHFGLTFGEVADGHWIGFDCAHSGDYVPSMEKFREKYRQEFTLPERFENYKIFNPEYRNMAYCVAQCEYIVYQLINIKNGIKNDE